MSNRRMSWFVRGDVDGFFGLALDNLVQLLVINALCTYVLGFSAELLYGRVLPAVAVSLLVGNFYYAWQAKRIGDRLGRDDLCALPYGINTPSVFAYLFLVMLPVKLAVQKAAQDAGPLVDQAVEVRRGHVVEAERRNGVEPLLIGDDEDDVGSRGCHRSISAAARARAAGTT